MRAVNADPCTILEWDSNFWGQRTARVVGDSLTETHRAAIDIWCRAHRVACLYFLARADDPETTRIAEMHGFHQMDIRVTLRREMAGVPQASSRASDRAEVRLYHPDDRPALEAIARASYRDSRFYCDRNFPRASCDALYTTWIARSCDGGADAVFVAVCGGRPVGYITCHRGTTPCLATIGLLAVGPEVRGGGIGGQLVRDALAWFVAHEATCVSVVTQGRNYAAQRLYQRCGFLTDTIGLWYHKWYPSSEVPG